jgi:putative transposase
VTDITWIQTRQGALYVAVIKDLYDGFIVAHAASSENSATLVTATLRRALRQHSDRPGLILHSDQGAQYSSHIYFQMTQAAHITPSMSRRGNCWDNAPMENFFGHLKAEAIYPLKLHRLQQAREVIDDYMYFYNHERIQLKTKLTPYELRCQLR